MTATVFKGQTVRLLIANLQALRGRGDIIKRYMKAYRETVDWEYSDPAALELYSSGSPSRLPSRNVRAMVSFPSRRSIRQDRGAGDDRQRCRGVEIYDGTPDQGATRPS